MSDTVISVESLGKRYRIAHQRSGPREGLRHVLNNLATAPMRWAKERFRNAEMPKNQNSVSISAFQRFSVSPAPPAHEDFWALRDVSFEVNRGEVVGIIGRNGAGKSTLLKILSRITEPTEGRVRIKGRVASLLEVGTGFHPELTGRENVYLNGAILGMSKAEIRAKFDEIIAFAEIEKFLDTPVKRYSSGMYVRLAFAVAAHLEPEILIVDEVLAVGDAQFQKKSLGKMGEVSRGGRTVLFVSHNMSAIRQLCGSAVLLTGGCVDFRGSAQEAVARYLFEKQDDSGVWKRTHPVPGRPGIYFQEIRILGENGAPCAHFNPEEKFRVTIELLATSEFERPQISLRFTNGDGVPAFCSCSTDGLGRFEPFSTGVHRLEVSLPAGFFMPGRYRLHFGSHLPRDRGFDEVDNALSIEIGSVGSLATLFGDNRPGVVTPLFPWKRL